MESTGNFDVPAYVHKIPTTANSKETVNDMDMFQLIPLGLILTNECSYPTIVMLPPIIFKVSFGISVFRTMISHLT